MRVKASCDLAMHLEVPTPLILMLRPRSGASQWITRENYTFSHPVTVHEYTDIFGNLCQRLLAPAEQFKIHSSVEVETTEAMDVCPGAPFINVEELPQEALRYLVPTRYCESDRLGAIAVDWAGDAWLGYDQVTQICARISEQVEYRPGSSDALLTADEARLQGYGVCRDMAHLGIALCRSISIPARLVVGYLVGLTPMDLHAWFEAFVGGRWYTFDPTQDNVAAPRIAIAYGRDAADVAIYHQFGPLPVTSSASVRVDIIQPQ